MKYYFEFGGLGHHVHLRQVTIKTAYKIHIMIDKNKLPCVHIHGHLDKYNSTAYHCKDEQLYCPHTTERFDKKMSIIEGMHYLTTLVKR